MLGLDNHSEALDFGLGVHHTFLWTAKGTIVPNDDLGQTHCCSAISAQFDGIGQEFVQKRGVDCTWIDDPAVEWPDLDVRCFYCLGRGRCLSDIAFRSGSAARRKRRYQNGYLDQSTA